jgi:hypothetical protein
MALLLDADGRVLVAPRGGAYEGEVFEAAGIVKDTLTTGRSFTRT